MKIKIFIKSFVKEVIKIQILNTLLRKLLNLSYIYSIVPKTIIEKIPVSGVICIKIPNSKEVYFKVDGNDTIANRLYWKGIDGFEVDTVLLYIKLLKFADTVLDIGANTGIYALIAATDNPTRKVYAFEPVPRVFKYLKTNVELNKVDNLQINSIAISNYDGEITLYIPSVNIPKTSSTVEGFREANEAISVRALSIDSFVNINNISKVDILKIDTETTEHLVLQGARNLLKRDEPIIICEVLKGKTEKFLHSVLSDVEYKYFLISSNGLIEKEEIEGDETYTDMNYLFITKRRMQEIMNLLSTDVRDSIFAKT